MQKRESKDFNPDLGMPRTKSTFDNGQLFWIMDYELWVMGAFNKQSITHNP